MAKINKINVEHFKVKRNKINQWDFDRHKNLEMMYDRLTMVAMGVFEWENLPITVDPVYLEREILRHGSLVFFKEDDMLYNEFDSPYFVLPYMASYQRNIYGEPVVRRAFTAHANSYRKTVTQKDSVIIYDNILKVNIDEMVYSFAKHLNFINEVKEENVRQQKTPYIIGATKEIEEEVQLFMEQVNSNKPYFIVDEMKADALINALKVYPTNTELIVNELQDYYDAIWNEFMVLVGVGTNVSTKRDRLVAGEVDGVNEQAQAFANARLNARERACKIINETFDLDKPVKVRFKFDKEVDNGTVHDNDTVDIKE